MATARRLEGIRGQLSLFCMLFYKFLTYFLICNNGGKINSWKKRGLMEFWGFISCVFTMP